MNKKKLFIPHKLIVQFAVTVVVNWVIFTCELQLQILMSDDPHSLL